MTRLPHMEQLCAAREEDPETESDWCRQEDNMVLWDIYAVHSPLTNFPFLHTICL
jgi:hypothetical protein